MEAAAIFHSFSSFDRQISNIILFLAFLALISSSNYNTNFRVDEHYR